MTAAVTTATGAIGRIHRDIKRASVRLIAARNAGDDAAAGEIEIEISQLAGDQRKAELRNFRRAQRNRRKRA